MYPTRKSSGSSSFLNRLQRNAQFGVETSEQTSSDSETSDSSAEELLTIIDRRQEWSIAELGAELSVEPQNLIEPLLQLKAIDCLQIEGDPHDEETRIAITDIGRKTANFARITSAR